jgi:hypothetical protein
LKPSHVALLVTVLHASSLFAGDQIGTRGFPFLRISVGARAVGMGEAFTAVASGAEGLEWNPAGVAQLNHPSLTTDYLSYFSDAHAGSVIFAQPAGRKATVGLSLRFFHVGGIPRTTLENPTGQGLGDFSSTDLCFKLGLAFRLTPEIYMGASGALISGTIDDANAFGVAGDFGLLAKNVVRRLRLGVAARHVGSMTSAYVNTTDPLPTQIAVGAAYPVFGRRLLLSYDWTWSVDWESEHSLGVEWEVVYDFFLRGGYRTHLSDLRDTSEDADLAGLTFGIGLRRIRAYNLDYAYASMGDLGGTHRFSFAWIF